MKIKNLLMVVLMLMSTVSAWADTNVLPAENGWKKITELPADAKLGDYYYAFVDNSLNLMLSLEFSGNQCNEVAEYRTMVYRPATDATLVPTMLWTLERNTNGGYSIKSAAKQDRFLQTEYNAAHNCRTHDNGGGDPSWYNWTFEYKNGSWVIGNGKFSDGNNYIGPWGNNGVVADGICVAGNCINESGNDRVIGKFQIYAIAKENYTTLIKLPVMSTDCKNNWTVTVTKNNKGDYTAADGYVEFFGGNVKKFSMKQTVKLPHSGKYLLKVQGFYRDGDNASSATAHDGGTENIRAVLYAGSATKKIKSVWEDAQTKYLYKNNTAEIGTWPSDYKKDGEDLYVPNSTNGAPAYFNAGLYWNTLEFVAKAGDIEIGIEQTEENTDYWALFNNFELIYLGEAENLDFSFFITNPNPETQTKNADGWTITTTGGNTPFVHGQFFEFWNGATTAKFDYYQDIEGLENGTYRVSADLYVDQYINEANNTTITDGVYAISGLNEVHECATVFATMTPVATTSVISVVNGKMRIGVKNFGERANQWFHANNFGLALVHKYTDEELANALPTANLTIGDAKYGTFCAPFHVEIPSGVTVKKITGVEGNGSTLTDETVTTTIPANTPVVVYSESPVNEVVSGAPVDVVTPETATVGLLTGVYTLTPAEDGWYILQNHDDEGVGFYQVDTNEAKPNVPANRCYLTAPAGPGANIRAFFFDAETAISAIEALSSGKAEIYNLNGVKLNSLQKGINIVNGKKIMVK